MDGNKRDENHDDFLGRCEGCGAMLFVGDRGLRCDDGPWLCADHCPTWAGAKKQWEAGENLDEDEERREDFNEAYAAHLAAGGLPDDLMSFPL